MAGEPTEHPVKGLQSPRSRGPATDNPKLISLRGARNGRLNGENNHVTAGLARKTEETQGPKGKETTGIVHAGSGVWGPAEGGRRW